MTPEQYLLICGWKQRATNYGFLIGDSRGRFEWIDPLTGERVRDESTDRAVAVQVERDRQRQAFVTAHKA